MPEWDTSASLSSMSEARRVGVLPMVQTIVSIVLQFASISARPWFAEQMFDCEMVIRRDGI